MTVLADCQLHELSMEAVAEAAGVGKPVLYTVFRTRAELVSELLRREHRRGLEQVLAGMPDDLTVPGPTGAYAATVSAFLRVVLEHPARWRLILTVPDSAPGPNSVPWGPFRISIRSMSYKCRSGSCP